MRRLQKIWIWGLFVFWLFSLFPDRSLAHAYIVRSTPAENETLSEAPSVIRIEFNEAIQRNFYSLKLINESGQLIQLHDVRIDKDDRKIIEADLQDRLANGTYTVRWKVVSSDGHRVEGTIPFQVGKNGEFAKSAPSKAESYSPKLDMVLIRWLFYISASLFVGMLFFKQIVEPKQKLYSFSSRYRLLYWLAYNGMSVSILLSLPLQVTVEADVPWSQAWRVSLLKKMLTDHSFGSVWLIQLALLVLLLIAGCAITYSKDRWLKPWTALSLIIGMGLLFMKTFIGHASASANPVISIFIDFLHLLAASIWLGGLCMIALALPLEALAKKERPDWNKYWATIKRFSYWGAVCVGTLILTGVYMSLEQVPTFNSLFSTMYGKLLIWKGILLVAMLLLAFVHVLARRRKKKLGATVWAEWGIGVGVLLLAAILTNLPPAVAAPGPFDQVKEIHGYEMRLKVTPNILGVNELRIDIKDFKGQPVKDIEQVTVTLTSKEMDMGENVLQIRGNRSGIYETQGMINMAGRWNIHIHALTRSLQSIDADFECFVGSQ
ncbi:copper resistance protein CopC [Anoxybacteroides tepidamans]|uniref:copper resistance protein CopC n=1 Tax=Anoxybacteroides tepidamans TaxID=265948 RepID=UPI000555B799|nr:copper resistance protein CopC [Anoxybacillus tepidamans]